MAGGLDAQDGAAQLFMAQATAPQNLLTSQQLIEAPLSEWGQILESGGQPANLDTFQQQLENTLTQSSRGVSRLNYAEDIARGTSNMDGRIERAGGPREFAETQIPNSVQLEGYRELYRDVYETAHGIRQSFVNGEIDEAQLDQQVEALMEFKDQQLQQLGESYEAKIGEAINQLKKPEQPAPDANLQQNNAPAANAPPPGGQSI